MSRPATLASATAAAAALVLALAACGGNDEAVEARSTTPSEPAETLPSVETDAPVETDAGSGTDPADVGPAPAPGQGTLELDDGRSYAITVTECTFQPNGTFSVAGTSAEGSTFTMGQLYLGEKWSQTQAAVRFPNEDQIYVIVSSASAGAEPAGVDGTTITLAQTFRELDESANAHVYSGEGVVRLTCP